MFEWTGDTCIYTLVITCRFESPIAILFLAADESINAAIIYSASTSSISFKDASGVKFDASLPLFWCPSTCTRDIPESID